MLTGRYSPRISDAIARDYAAPDSTPPVPAAASDLSFQAFPPLIDRCVALTGVTGSGKSAVAMALARDRREVEIVSIDSVAVYRGMSIGSAKPTPHDRAAVPHHLIDLVDPDTEFNIAEYLAAAHRVVDEIRGRGHVALLVGGTPLYLKALLRGFDPGPPPDADFRAACEADVRRFGLPALHARLSQVDPVAATRIDPADGRRMIRALEFSHATGGRRISDHQVQFESARSLGRGRVFAVSLPRGESNARIDARVEAMIAGGWEVEVRGLLSRFGGLSKTAAQAVGYRELIDWCGRWDRPVSGEVVAEIQRATRKLAKRQRTWLKSLAEVQEADVQRMSAALDTVPRLSES